MSSFIYYYTSSLPGRPCFGPPGLPGPRTVSSYSAPDVIIPQCQLQKCLKK